MMRYSITISTALLFLAVHAGAQAQADAPSSPSATPWTLEQCIQYAVENSPETNIQAARSAACCRPSMLR